MDRFFEQSVRFASVQRGIWQAEIGTNAMDSRRNNTVKNCQKRQYPI